MLGPGSASGSDSDSNSAGDGTAAVRLPFPPRTVFNGAVEEWAMSGGNFEDEGAEKESLLQKRFPIAMFRAGQSGRVTVLEVTRREDRGGGRRGGGVAGRDGGQCEEMLEFRIYLDKKNKVPWYRAYETVFSLGCCRPFAFVTSRKAAVSDCR